MEAYIKTKLRDLHVGGDAVEFMIYLVQNRRSSSLFKDQEVKQWMNEAAARLVDAGDRDFTKNSSPYYIHHLITTTDQFAAKPWTVLKEETVAAALGLLTASSSSHGEEMLKPLRAAWKDNEIFMREATKAVASVLGNTLQEALADKANSGKKVFVGGSQFQAKTHSLMMDFPELLSESRDTFAMYMENYLAESTPREEWNAFSDGELREMIRSAEVVDIYFQGASFTKRKAKAAEKAEWNITRNGLLDTAMKPEFMRAVERQPAFHESLLEHCLQSPQTYPRTLKRLAGCDI